MKGTSSEVYMFSPSYRVWYATEVISEGMDHGIINVSSAPCQTFSECESFARELRAEPVYNVGSITKKILAKSIWFEDPNGERVEKRKKRRSSQLTLAEVSTKIVYDKDNKTLIWISGKNAGTQAVQMDRNGNPFVRFNGIERSAYRISWLLHHGSLPENRIRCVGSDRSNMSISNLKEEIQKEK